MKGSHIWIAENADGDICSFDSKEEAEAFGSLINETHFEAEPSEETKAEILFRLGRILAVPTFDLPMNDSLEGVSAFLGIPVIEKYKGMSAEEIYNDLKDKQ